MKLTHKNKNRGSPYFFRWLTSLILRLLYDVLDVPITDYTDYLFYNDGTLSLAT